MKNQNEPVSVLGEGVIYLAPVFKECKTKSVAGFSVTGCVIVEQDNKGNFIFSVTINDYKVFSVKSKGNFQKEFSLEKVPVIGAVIKNGRITVSKFSFGNGKFSCEIKLEVELPFLGWTEIKKFKVSKNYSTFRGKSVEEDSIYIFDSEDTQLVP